MSAHLPLPKQIVVHGFLFNRGEKMSKSTGNIIAPGDLISRFGVDPVRYFFMREVPYGQDGSYSLEAIVGRLNAELANDLGNLAQRSLSMINRNCGGKSPHRGTLTAADEDMLAAARNLLPEVRAHHESYAISKAMDAIWRTVAQCNRYFAGQEPWALKKTDPARMATVLWVTTDVLRRVGLLIQPYVPASAARLLDLLAVPPEKRSFSAFGDELPAGTSLPAPTAVFPRFVETVEET
jgi:methionyl-tRNA synthetase